MRSLQWHIFNLLERDITRQDNNDTGFKQPVNNAIEINRLLTGCLFIGLSSYDVSHEFVFVPTKPGLLYGWRIACY